MDGGFGFTRIVLKAYPQQFPGHISFHYTCVGNCYPSSTCPEVFWFTVTIGDVV